MIPYSDIPPSRRASFGVWTIAWLTLDIYYCLLCIEHRVLVGAIHHHLVIKWRGETFYCFYSRQMMVYVQTSPAVIMAGSEAREASNS